MDDRELKDALGLDHSERRSRPCVDSCKRFRLRLNRSNALLSSAEHTIGAATLNMPASIK